MSTLQISPTTVERVREAMEYVQQGFSVIPLYGPDEPRNEPPDKRGKRPPLPWKEYQTRQPTEAEIREWFGSDKTYNIGIVTGAVSRITIVDFDSPEAVQLAKERNFPVTPLVKPRFSISRSCQQ